MAAAVFSFSKASTLLDGLTISNQHKFARAVVFDSNSAAAARPQTSAAGKLTDIARARAAGKESAFYPRRL